MDLSYRDLKKRDVINVVDGRCLGRIIDVVLSFPKGVLKGIVVPGRRVYGFRLFDRTELYIDESRIIKIGGDVILVDVNCGEVCSPSVPPNKKPPPPPNHPPFSPNNFGCNDFCATNSKQGNCCNGNVGGNFDVKNADCQDILDVCRIDQSDY